MHFLVATIKKPAVWLLIVVVYAGILFACQPRLALADGKPAPDFKLPDGLGHTVSLSDLRGSVVLLNFWATWCEPCTEELPVFQDLFNQYGKSGFQVVIVSVGDTLQVATRYIQGKGYTFISLVDTQKVTENSYAANTLPATVLIDLNRQVVDSWIGPVDDDLVLSKQIEKLLPTKTGASPTILPATRTPDPTPTLTLSDAVFLTETSTLTSTAVTPTPLTEPTSSAYLAPHLVSPGERLFVLPGFRP